MQERPLAPLSYDDKELEFRNRYNADRWIIKE